MTTDEAVKVIKILLKCDNACETCTHDLINDFCCAFPQYKEIAKQHWETEFEEKFDE